MLAVDNAIAAHDWGKLPRPTVSLHGQPTDEAMPSLLWDGEWEITWVTFRDMGAAFMVALLGIYVLVVGQFRSFKIPLVTPLTRTVTKVREREGGLSPTPPYQPRENQDQKRSDSDL